MKQATPLTAINDVMAEMRRKRDNALALGKCAPRLLAVLKDLVDDITHEDHSPGDWSAQVCVRNARAAIEEAEGELS